MHIEKAYYVAFSHFLGIGPHRFSLLLKTFKTAEAAYNASAEKLSKVLGAITLKNFQDFRNVYKPTEKVKEITEKGIKIVALCDDNYPQSLKNITDPPICIYIKGNYDVFDFEKGTFFGIVGTRSPSPYGQQISRIFSEGLTQAGVTIVSGMALGVDTIAHKAALDKKGRTIAVLGCGVDIVYPFANKKLYEQIIKEGSIVCSEFPPGMTTLKGLFVARNRLISGLSAGIMVVEGLKTSGSLITAKYAAEQGKDVYAPPVPLTSALSEAPTILLKQGAKLTFSPEDILQDYNLPQRNIFLQEDNIFKHLLEEEIQIVRILKEEARGLDSLSKVLQKPLSEILVLISSIEIKGIIVKNLEGKYQIKV